MDIEKLEKINELKEKGVISEEEFNKMKKELMSTDNSKANNDKEISLWEYYSNCLRKKYVCFEGRASRREYWGFVLYWNIFYLIMNVLSAASGTPWYIIFSIVTMLPSIAVIVRRLHDVNMSGWLLLTIVVPFFAVFFKSDMKENKYGPVPEGVLK